jgi:hypothetical protein
MPTAAETKFWTARPAISAKPARLSHSSSRPAHSIALDQPKLVRSKRLVVAWSQTSQESKSRAQASSWASVTASGSSMKQASRRAS